MFEISSVRKIGQNLILGTSKYLCQSFKVLDPKNIISRPRFELLSTIFLFRRNAAPVTNQKVGFTR